MGSIEKKIFKDSKRIIVKVGSSLILNQKNGEINKDIIGFIVDDIKNLMSRGKEIMLVSSGALSLGKNKLDLKEKILKMSEKQAAASVGQIILINAWQEVFFKNKVQCAQILLTHLDAEIRKSSINARNTIESLIKLKTIAIINENDTVATKELRYGDNDQLAARVAQITSSDLCILLSDVDGLYDENPLKNPDAKLIKKIYKIDKYIERISDNTMSSVSVGGMETKIKAAKIALASGCNMVITNGYERESILSLEKEKKASWFIANTSPLTARKKWISSQMSAKASIVIDKGAAAALKEGASLLPAGILSVKGFFDKGDVINVIDKNENIVSVGLSSYSSEDVKLIAGAKSNEIEKLLGYHNKDVIVHRDDMVIRN